VCARAYLDGLLRMSMRLGASFCLVSRRSSNAQARIWSPTSIAVFATVRIAASTSAIVTGSDVIREAERHCRSALPRVVFVASFSLLPTTIGAGVTGDSMRIPT
jgi:hypothetical protein